jgi:hypothetical protein
MDIDQAEIIDPSVVKTITIATTDLGIAKAMEIA